MDSFLNNVSFKKLHGLGNDFIVILALDRDSTLRTSRNVTASVAKQLCDRHRGIGGDGVILVTQPTQPNAHVEMRIFNADGSEAEMCGNGIRCVVKALCDATLSFTASKEIVVSSHRNNYVCKAIQNPNGIVDSVRVDMGKPHFERSQIPMLGGSGEFVEQPFSVDQTSFYGTAVNLGNPHIVFFIDDNRNLEDLARRYGPLVERHPLFPQKTNVEFARIHSPSSIEVWIWERGCGITHACGTGACATAVASMKTGKIPPGSSVEIQLPGGILHIDVSGDLEQITMIGPVEHVFDGMIAI